MEEMEALSGWIKLYHPGSGGVQCTLPVPAAPLTEVQARGLFESVQSLIGAGFLVNQTGLLEGERRETVSHLAHRRKQNPDGSSIAILDVYCGGNWKVLHLYMNKSQDLDRFTQVFGLMLSDIPLWQGEAPLERGKDPETDSRYILPVKGVEVVYRTNPRWEGEEDKKHPKRLFIRWESSKERPMPIGIAETMVRTYTDGSRVNGNLIEQQSFDRYLEIHKEKPVSRDALRAWVSQNPAGVA